MRLQLTRRSARSANRRRPDLRRHRRDAGDESVACDRRRLRVMAGLMEWPAESHSVEQERVLRCHRFHRVDVCDAVRSDVAAHHLVAEDAAVVVVHAPRVAAVDVDREHVVMPAAVVVAVADDDRRAAAAADVRARRARRVAPAVCPFAFPTPASFAACIGAIAIPVLRAPRRNRSTGSVSNLPGMSSGSSNR